MKKAGIVIVISSLTLTVYLLYSYFQPTYSYHLLDSRYDALKYAKAYDYFNDFAADYQLSFPFNARILMPWLAAQLPFNDLKTDFIWLNGLFIVLTVGMLTFVWQKLQIRLSLILIGLFWVLFHWKGLIRMYLPDPVTADVGGYFWLALFLGFLFIGEGKWWSDSTSDSILLSSKTGHYQRAQQKPGYKNWKRVLGIFAFLLIAVLGTLQKESSIAVLGVTVLCGGGSVWLVRTPTTARVTALWAWANVWLVQTQTPTTVDVSSPRLVSAPTGRGLLILLFAFLFAVSAHYLASHFFPASTSDWRNSSLISLFRGIKRYMVQPELFLRLPMSWLFAYGTFWLALLSISKLSPNLPLHTSHSSLLTPHFCLWLLLSVFGGGDTTRILFNGMPFVLTFLLLRLNQKSNWVGWYILFTSLPLMRLTELEPDLGLYPQATQRWCVECWTLGESWGYWMYAIAVLTGYYYFLRRFGAVGRDKTNHVNARR